MDAILHNLYSYCSSPNLFCGHRDNCDNFPYEKKLMTFFFREQPLMGNENRMATIELLIITQILEVI